jgi:hypothetical protein
VASKTNIVYGVFCHDAGGANVIAKYILNKNLNYIFCGEGPARKIFQQEFDSKYARTFSAIIEEADIVIPGTSWQGSLEIDAINAAKVSGKKVVSVLDHLVEYPIRFIRGGVCSYPDEFWVCDEASKSIASECLPSLPIKIIGNPLLESALGDLKKIQLDYANDSLNRSLLYISDHISGFTEAVFGDPLYWGYSDLDAIEFCLDYLSKIGFTYDEFIIRPHPSDNPKIFEGLPAVVEGAVSISSNPKLLADISKSSIVFGGISMALLIADTCRKNVVFVDHPNSTIPKLYSNRFKDLSSFTCQDLEFANPC